MHSTLPTGAQPVPECGNNKLLTNLDAGGSGLDPNVRDALATLKKA
jgi:hypothetical protein